MEGGFERRRINGRILRKFIDEHFENYKDFANTFKASQTSVSNWVTGRGNVPQHIIYDMAYKFPNHIATFKKLNPELF
jgi:hypothetical protein